MPDFEFFEERLLQKEVYGAGTGLHYGKSTKSDIMLYWNGLSEEEKSNPFYKGYLWHLLTDLVMYTNLDMDKKLEKFMKLHEGAENLAELRAGEIDKLHTDWDRTNARVRDTYPDTALTPEVEELGVIQFIESGELHYVDWGILRVTIDFLRGFNPLNGNLDDYIWILMSVKQ